jgi:hypothetical protein
MNDGRTPLERDQDAAIRRWLDAAPERASDRAVSATIDALRETKQPRRVVLSMSLPMAAAVALLAVVLIGGLALRGLGPLPAASPTPTPAPSGACSLEQEVAGRNTFYVGRGFAPNSDVRLEIERANGEHLTLTPAEIASLHTDAHGRFGVEFLAFSEDVGTGHMTAIAGCTASLEYVVTAEQVGPPCIDPALAQPLNDGAAYRAAVEAHSPIHWWHLDEQDGRVALDAVTGIAGTWQGTLQPIAGVDGGGALFFEGDGGSYVAVPAITLDEFTVEAWVYLCDYADNQDALVGDADHALDINFFAARLRLFASDADDVVIASSVARIGVWEHWALSRDASGVTRVFHNGVLDATGAVWNSEMRITDIGRGNAGTLRGAIDELAIYERALSEEELTAHALAR